MRKQLVCLIGAIILLNSEFSCKQSKAQDEREEWAGQVNLLQRERSVEYVIKDIHGMTYLIASGTRGWQTSPFFVNLTLERLQIEKTKLEIELLNKQLNTK